MWLRDFYDQFRLKSKQNELLNAILNKIKMDKKLNSYVTSRISSFTQIRKYLTLLISQAPCPIIIINEENIRRGRAVYRALGIEPSLLKFRKDGEKLFEFPDVISTNLNNYIDFTPTRVNRGECTTQAMYKLPLLESLVELGGAGTVSEVLDRVYEKMVKNMKQADFEYVPSGSLRWEKQVNWTRNGLKNMGFLRKNSPIGLWEITNRGRRYLEKMKRKDTLQIKNL